MPFGAVFVATCLAAAFGCILMGFLANYPIALAPGMGLNAFFAFGVVRGMGDSWQVALGGVFISGVIFFFSVLPVREWLINAIPSAQVGDRRRDRPVPCADRAEERRHRRRQPGDPGDARRPAQAALSSGDVGFFDPGARSPPRDGRRHHRHSVVTSSGSWPASRRRVSTCRPAAPTFLQLDLAARWFGLMTIVFAFLFVDLFDNAGTLVGSPIAAASCDRTARCRACAAR